MMNRKHWKLAGMVALAGAIICVMTYAVIQETNQKVSMTENEEEEPVAMDQVPEAVQTTIQTEAQGGTIKEIERENENGKTIYEAEVILNGQEVEIKIASDGTLLKKEVEDGDDDDDNNDDDDDNDDEEEVTLDQVPAAVKATIQKEAPGGTIEEIELGNENGKSVYEADVIINGQEVEIKVAPDGTLLGKEVEDEDDGDEDDDEDNDDDDGDN